MQHIVIILANPETTSFNHAIAKTIAVALEKKGYPVILHDLYREGFDPMLRADEIPRDVIIPPEIEKHCSEVGSSLGLIFVHPNWWGQPPAILKGWIDRVIRPGRAYEFLEGDSGEGVPRGLLEGKTALVFNTSNTPEVREKKFFGDPLDMIWKKCIFEFCGIRKYHRKNFSVVATSTEEQRISWLKEAESITVRYFPGYAERT